MSNADVSTSLDMTMGRRLLDMTMRRWSLDMTMGRLLLDIQTLHSRNDDRERPHYIPTNERSEMRTKKKEVSDYSETSFVVGAEGVEPPTLCL